MAGMKENSKKLGIDDLYLVFICMVTGRTLDAVVGGINKVKYSDAEVSSCRCKRRNRSSGRTTNSFWYGSI